MSTAYIVALSIVIISVIVLIVAAVIAGKKVKPTLNNFNNLTKNIEDTANRYGKDGERIQEKISVVQERVELTQLNAEQKFQSFDELQTQFQSLSNSLMYLKEYSTEFSDEASGSLVDTIKEEGPTYLQIMKGTAKRTFDKQKARYN